MPRTKLPNLPLPTDPRYHTSYPRGQHYGARRAPTQYPARPEDIARTMIERFPGWTAEDHTWAAHGHFDRSLMEQSLAIGIHRGGWLAVHGRPLAFGDLLDSASRATIGEAWSLGQSHYHEARRLADISAAHRMAARLLLRRTARTTAT